MAIIAILILDLALASRTNLSTIPLRIGTRRDELDVLEVKEWMRKHHFAEMSVSAKVLHQVTLLSCFFIGTTAKYAVLKSIWKDGPLSKPINIFIIAEQFVAYFIWLVMLATGFSLQTSGVPIARLLGNDDVCDYMNGFANFGPTYTISSGFITSAFRFLCLNWPEKIKRLGDWTLMLLM